MDRYNAFTDQNMIQYFEKKGIQNHLWQTNQIQSNGSRIGFDKNTKSKLQIIEKQFQDAEKREAERLKEEEELRERIRAQRINDIERDRKAERVRQIKEDRMLHRKLESMKQSINF